MRYIRNKFYLLALGLVLALAGFFRFWAAPLSAGPDVAQFWAFAKVFQLHGLDFYRYADATSMPIFPFHGWGFVYPPLWLLILRLSLLAAPTSYANGFMVATSWRLAMKAPIIVADLVIGCLLYWAVPGSKPRKLLFASLWLFHPTAWYVSAVFGQFDAIAAALLLASIIVLERGKDRLAFLLAGLAVMTKQYTLISIAVMVIILARHMSKRRLISNCAIIAGIAILLSIPFLLNGNFSSYARSVLQPGQWPDYQYLLMFSFSGIGALLTYLHNVFSWETSGLLQFCTPVLVVALLAALVFSYIRGITLIRGMLIGILLFIGIFYRVNYQYLAACIQIALLLASRTQYRSERVMAMGLALLPAAWLWLFDVPAWFKYFVPAHAWVTPIFAHIGLAHQDIPDYAYVSFSLVLMCLALAYIVFAFLRWRKPVADGSCAKVNSGNPV